VVNQCSSHFLFCRFLDPNTVQFTFKIFSFQSPVNSDWCCRRPLLVIDSTWNQVSAQRGIAFVQLGCFLTLLTLFAQDMFEWCLHSQNEHQQPLCNCAAPLTQLRLIAQFEEGTSVCSEILFYLFDLSFYFVLFCAHCSPKGSGPVFRKGEVQIPIWGTSLRNGVPWQLVTKWEPIFRKKRQISWFSPAQSEK
jgi:hypothetical protein